MLGDDKGMEVVAKLVAAQATVFAKASLDPISRQAAREAAMEAVTGSYVSPTPVLLCCSPHLLVAARLLLACAFSSQPLTC